MALTHRKLLTESGSVRISLFSAELSLKGYWQGPRSQEMGVGVGGRGVGTRETMLNVIHCHHQNDYCVKMGSSESHFTISLTVSSKTMTTSSF